MSKYSELFKELEALTRQHQEHFNVIFRLKEAIDKAEKYDVMMDNPTEWYTAGMKEATKDIARLEQNLKEYAKVISDQNKIMKITTDISNEKRKRIKELEKENQILKEGIKAEYLLLDEDRIDEKERYNKIKAMLDLMEVIEDDSKRDVQE